MMVSTQGERGGPRGFIWIDMQQGIALGGIFFHPTNGEPTPTLTLFSKQVEENSLEMSQLPLSICPGFEPMGRDGKRPTDYNALLHHCFEQKDCAGTR